MRQNLDSKTVLGLLTLLSVAVIMALLGKLSPEMVEVLRWVGGSYMAVRVAANVSENLPQRRKISNEDRSRPNRKHR